MIYNPFLEHLYTGVRGAGSFLQKRVSVVSTRGTSNGTSNGISNGISNGVSNGISNGISSTGPSAPQRLPLAPARPLPSLTGALIGSEWGADRSQDAMRAKSSSYSKLAGGKPHGVLAHGLRSVGSGALTIALVAQGALDMFWLADLSSTIS